MNVPELLRGQRSVRIDIETSKDRSEVCFVIVSRARSKKIPNPAAMLPCVRASVGQIDRPVRRLLNLGVRLGVWGTFEKLGYPYVFAVEIAYVLSRDKRSRRVQTSLATAICTHKNTTQ